MKKDQSIHIHDMVASIDLIQNNIKQCSYDKFLKDITLQDAIIRRLQIIAEAARRIDNAFKALHEEIPWQKINGLRNAIVHDYDDVDLESIWDTITHDLPTLKESLMRLQVP